MPSTLRSMEGLDGLGKTKAGRLLQSIKRDMDLKGALMRKRLRNEEILSLKYQDDGKIGGGNDADNLRENALNYPYRWLRWMESMATSKRLVVKVSRDAGPGQKKGGPGDNETGMWQGVALERVAYEAGFKREMAAVMGEVAPRGVSVMGIGYHEEVISLTTSTEVGKDTQSIQADVQATGDVEAKRGQAHSEASEGLANIAGDPLFQMEAGREGVAAILARKDSHDEADFQQETDRKPIESVRLLRHRVWMQKRRVGEDVGWDPSVYDVEDAKFWWDRHVWTVAEVKASDLFSKAFKRMVKGYDGRNVSGVASGAQTPSTESMGSDARMAQSEDILDDDERVVEWFACWFKRPEMKSGGFRRIVCAEDPEHFIEADDANPHVDAKGFGLIPGFYPFYDFAPLKSSLTIPERTCGLPPMAVGMTQFEQIAELARLEHESALRHSLRLYGIDPAQKDNKKLINALNMGTDGFCFIENQAQVQTSDGKLRPGVNLYQFSGNTQDIGKQIDQKKAEWVQVMGMPPAVLQGMGTAETAQQDKMGLAAGQNESGAILSYMETRAADVLAGLRGLMRGNYDDEDWVLLLGEDGMKVMKAWQETTSDNGDSIDVTFGMMALQKEAVERKQLMEVITLKQAQIDPITKMPKYDVTQDVEELHRRLDLGAPKLSAENESAKDQMILQMAALIQKLTGVDPLQPNQGGGAGQGPGASKPPGGPNPSEGNGPDEGNLSAGARRGTVEPAPQPA